MPGHFTQGIDQKQNFMDWAYAEIFMKYKFTKNYHRLILLVY